ncbi:Kinesin light chain 3, partial [Chytriomyces hyalinus]
KHDLWIDNCKENAKIPVCAVTRRRSAYNPRSPILTLSRAYKRMGRERSARGNEHCKSVRNVLKPMTRDGGKSLCATYAESYNIERQNLLGKADWFVSHSWGTPSLDTVNALEVFFSDKGLDLDKTMVWFDLFSNGQHDTGSKPFDWWKTAFLQAVQAIGRVVMILMPWRDPVPLKRAWCVYELYACHLTRSRFDFAVTRAEKAAFMDWLVWHVESFFLEHQHVGCRQSQATKASDRKAIFAVIKSGIGFVKLDLLVLNTVRDWVRVQIQRKIKNEPAVSRGWLEVYKDFKDVEEAFDDAVRRATKIFGTRNPHLLRFGSYGMSREESMEEKTVRLSKVVRKRRWQSWKKRFIFCTRADD